MKQSQVSPEIIILPPLTFFVLFSVLFSGTIPVLHLWSWHWASESPGTYINGYFLLSSILYSISLPLFKTKTPREWTSGTVCFLLPHWCLGYWWHEHQAAVTSAVWARLAFWMYPWFWLLCLSEPEAWLCTNGVGAQFPEHIASLSL